MDGWVQLTSKMSFEELRWDYLQMPSISCGLPHDSRSVTNEVTFESVRAVQLATCIHK